MNTRRRLEEIAGPLSLGSLLEAHRLGEEWTLKEMAEKLKISAQNLSDIEKGRKGVSPERAAKFAKALGLSKEQFVRLALQGLVDEAGLKMKVKIEAA